MEADGRPLPDALLAGRQGRLVLAYLVCERHRSVLRDELAELLWPDRLPSSWTASLSVVISKLRRLLGEAGLDPTTTLASAFGSYRLHLPADAWVDWEAAAQGVEAAERAVAGGEFDAAVKAAEVAAEIARRGFLTDSCPWVDSQRERLADLHVRAVQAKAQAHLAAGQRGRAVITARDALALDELREGSYRLLMQALAAAGERAEALRVWERCRATLVDELGVDPAPETESLYLSILGESTVPPVTAARLPSGVVTFLLTDIVNSTRLWEAHSSEMTEALARHDAALAEAVADHGGTLLKTRGEGDSTFSVFERATQAAAAAVAAQHSLRDESWPAGIPFEVRMALHTGEAHERDGDYYGPTVNRAARLRAIASGGQILVSQSSAEVVADHLDPAVKLIPLGEHQLVDLARPERVFSLVGTDAVRPSVESPEGGVPIPAVLAANAAVAFVGRGTELDRLLAAWREATTGSRRIVFIAGEPGIGKTRLAAQLVRTLADDGAIALYGRCDEEMGVAYQPFAEVIRHYVNHCPRGPLRDHVSTFGGVLTRLVPDLERRVPTPPAPTMTDAESDRLRLFEAVGSLLTNASGARPVVAVLDDLHWADKGSLLLLRHLVRQAEPARLLVVGIYRDTDLSATHPLSDTLADMHREQRYQRVLLRGLSSGEVLNLIEAMAHQEVGREGVELAKALHTETEGNPFFVEEIVRHLVETGGVVETEGRWTITAAVDALGIPQSVTEVIGRRLARLSEPALRVLTAAAVMGRQFSVRTLEVATDTGSDELLEHLEEAVDAQLVAEVPGVIGELTFSHALIQETLYDRLSAMRRARLHRRVAQAIETGQAANLTPHLSELAYHYLRTGESTDRAIAIDYASRAGDHALSQLAYEEAVSLFEAAVEAAELQDPPDLRQLGQLLLRLGEAQLTMGDVLSVQATELHAADCARRVDDAELLAGAALGISVMMGPLLTTVTGAVDETVVGLLEEALAALPPDDSVLRASLLARLAAGLYSDPAQLDYRTQLATEAVDMARRLEDDRLLATVLSSTHIVLWTPDNVAERLQDTEELLRLDQATGQRDLIVQTRSVRIWDLLELGDTIALDAEIAAFDAVALQLRRPLYLAFSEQFHAMQAILAGRWEDAERLAAEGYERLLRVNNPMAGTYYQTQLTAIWFATGKIADMAGDIFSLLNPDSGGYGPVRCAMAAMLTEFGHPEEGRALVQGVIDDDFAAVPFDTSWLCAMHFLALAATLLGDKALAVPIYERLLPYRDLVIAAGHLQAMGLVAHDLGSLALVLGRYDDAGAHYEHAVEMAQRMRCPPFLAEAQCSYGKLLLTIGQTERAALLINEAAATANELGMRPLAARAAQYLSELSA